MFFDLERSVNAPFKTISSEELVDEIRANGIDVQYIPDRSMIASLLLKSCNPSDILMIMGARDDTLAEFSRTLLNQLY